jgi:hypothetical protein
MTSTAKLHDLYEDPLHWIAARALKDEGVVLPRRPSFGHGGWADGTGATGCLYRVRNDAFRRKFPEQITFRNEPGRRGHEVPLLLDSDWRWMVYAFTTGHEQVNQNPRIVSYYVVDLGVVRHEAHQRMAEGDTPWDGEKMVPPFVFFRLNNLPPTAVVDSSPDVISGRREVLFDVQQMDKPTNALMGSDV